VTDRRGSAGRSAWLPVALIVAGGATAGATIAALVLSVDSSDADIVATWLALVAFLCFALVAAAWVLSARRVPSATTRVPAEGAEERAELASSISHELRGPLMSVKGLAASGTRLYGSMSDDERLEFFRLIDAEATRMKTVLEATSTALKIDAGSLRYETRDEDLSKLVEEVAWHSPVGEHAMVVEAEDGLIASVDRVRSAEALANLIDNAAKYSPSDAPIEVRAYRSPEGEAVVEVVDRGPGIPPEQREAVFRRYCRWRPAGYEAIPGAGLGLSIAKAHVLAQGGRLEVEDDPDGGTMLRIVLPPGRGQG
jgi:signal transduction histidine kinase